MTQQIDTTLTHTMMIYNTDKLEAIIWLGKFDFLRKIKMLTDPFRHFKDIRPSVKERIVKSL